MRVEAGIPAGTPGWMLCVAGAPSMIWIMTEMEFFLSGMQGEAHESGDALSLLSKIK